MTGCGLPRREQFPGQPRRAHHHFADVGERGARVAVLSGQALIDVAEDRGEAVVEVVGEAARQPSDRVEPLGALEAGGQLPALADVHRPRHQARHPAGAALLEHRPLARGADLLVAHHADEASVAADRRVEHRHDAVRDQVRVDQFAGPRIVLRVVGGERERGFERRQVARGRRHRPRPLVRPRGADEQVEADEGLAIVGELPHADALDFEQVGGALDDPLDGLVEVPEVGAQQLQVGLLVPHQPIQELAALAVGAPVRVGQRQHAADAASDLLARRLRRPVAGAAPAEHDGQLGPRPLDLVEAAAPGRRAEGHVDDEQIDAGVGHGARQVFARGQRQQLAGDAFLGQLGLEQERVVGTLRQVEDLCCARHRKPRCGHGSGHLLGCHFSLAEVGPERNDAPAEGRASAPDRRDGAAASIAGDARPGPRRAPSPASACARCR